ncbi:MAG TPA: DUF5916 domain-containing protein [Bacteroidales bacterium]|nr:DUF5916 domain-containing protein [Bacteroidales bacterium]
MKNLILVVLLTLSSCPLVWAGIQKLADEDLHIKPESDTLSHDPVFISKLPGSFKFDGVIDDPCWENLAALPMVMHIPTFGNQPTERSEVFICHDNEYIYIAGRFFDQEAGKIKVSSRKRDNIGPQEDSFFVIFDTFNDHENGVVFHTNAAGVRHDMTISNDAADDTEGFPWNDTWNTFWDVKSSRNDQGWYTEMRIPLSSLRFEEKNGLVKMGLICFRFIPRKFELDVFPAIPRKWGFWSFVKPSQAQRIELEGVQGKKPFYIAPYFTGGINQESRLNAAETDYIMHKDPKLAVGLDVKYGITNNLTADLTLNTDFAQVESDNAQINLTRFSLFFPEKRMFFQERSSNFTFAFDDMNTLFYSRRIGLHEGRPVPIIGGVRLVGRAGPWDIGFLDMQTQSFRSGETDGADLPAENFGVLRFRRQVFNSNSYVGGIITSRLGNDGTYNEVAGFDGIIRVFGDDYLDIKYAQSFDEKYKNKAVSLDASRIWIDWQRRNAKGLGYDFLYSRAGGKYEPDLGFEFRRNYYMIGTKLKYGWIPGESSKISSHRVMINAQAWRDIGNHATQSSLVGAGYYMNTKSGIDLQMMFNRAYENPSDTFYLSNDAVVAYVPLGEYNYFFAKFNANTPHTKTLVFLIASSVGQYYDGKQFTIRSTAILNLGAFLRLEPSYEYVLIRFPERDQVFTGHIVSLNSVIMVNNKLSISALADYSNIAQGILTNLRLRYNPKEGNDLYLVFNEGRNIGLDRESPVLNRVANRGILIKYTYTFIL